MGSASVPDAALGVPPGASGDTETVSGAGETPALPLKPVITEVVGVTINPWNSASELSQGKNPEHSLSTNQEPLAVTSVVKI